MRSVSVLLLVFFIQLVLMAAPVTPDEARQRISKSMGSRRANVALNNLQLVATSHYRAQDDVMAPSYYVFNVGDGKGYIIAGADDCVPAVFGYSDKGTFSPQDIPDNMKSWLRGYDEQMEYLNQHPEALVRKSVSGDEIIPLLKDIEWDQESPYNDLCPQDGNLPSVTGCVATSMAQIMYYWKYPSQTVAEIPSYTSSTRGFKLPAIPAGTIIDWDNMKPRYTGKEPASQIQAVAKLMLLCGTAVKMDYTYGGSGAPTRSAAYAWLKYLDYDAATRCLSRDDYRSEEWNQMIYNELKEGRPVFYSGESLEGAHAFVVDGYGGDDFFHVNWGWRGSYNDYFLLSILDPHATYDIEFTGSTNGFSFNQFATLGVQPNTGMQPQETPVLTTSDISCSDNPEIMRNNHTDNFIVKVEASFWNNNSSIEPIRFEFGYGVYDESNKLIAHASKGWSEPLETGYGYNSLEFTLSFGANITTGTYLLKPICRVQGTETWYANKGTDIYYLTAVINNNVMTIAEPSFGLTGSLQVIGNKEVGSPLTLTASISNEGSAFNRDIYLIVDGEIIGIRRFDIDAGETKDVNFTFTPLTEGEKELNVCVEYWNSDKGSTELRPIIQSKVTITPADYNYLTLTPTIKNAIKEAGQDVVKADKVIVNIQVKNGIRKDYNNDIFIKIYELHDDNYAYCIYTGIKTIQLAAQSSTEVEFQKDNLKNGTTYLYSVYYKSKGELVRSNLYWLEFMVKFETQSILDSPVLNTIDNPTIIGCFTPDGKRTETLQHGLNIIRLSDGSTKKIILQ